MTRWLLLAASTGLSLGACTEPQGPTESAAPVPHRFLAALAPGGAQPLYVADMGDNNITVYGAGASGNVARGVTIAGPLRARRVLGTGIAVDREGNIYVTNPGAGSITVYPARRPS